MCLRCSDLMYGGCFTEFSVYIDISKLSFFFVIPVLLVPPCLLQHDGESLSHHELNKPEVSHVHHILNRAPRHAHSVAHVPGDVGSVTRDLIPGKGTDLSLRTCRMLSHVHHVPDHAPDLIHCVAPSPGDVKCVARTLDSRARSRSRTGASPRPYRMGPPPVSLSSRNRYLGRSRSCFPYPHRSCSRSSYDRHRCHHRRSSLFPLSARSSMEVQKETGQRRQVVQLAPSQ